MGGADSAQDGRETNPGQAKIHAPLGEADAVVSPESAPGDSRQDEQWQREQTRPEQGEQGDKCGQGVPYGAEAQEMGRCGQTAQRHKAAKKDLCRHGGIGVENVQAV